MTFRDRLAHIQDAIATHAEGRPVTLVAVSKYATLAQMEEAYEAGVRHFGENKVQDALAKMEQFSPECLKDTHWHFIGNLQTNKVKKTLGRFDLIHAVDSVRLADALSTTSLAAGNVQNVLLQVNLSEDVTRHGFLPDALFEVFPEMLSLKGIAVRGLMGMAPPEASLSGDERALKSVFCRLRDVRDQLAEEAKIALPELSMGMTHDFTHALACGATIIRIGNYLFKN